MAILTLALGCATEPGPVQMTQVGPQAASNREAQTRRFSGVSEAELLAACVGVLQDQGFRITSSEGRLGMIAGSKTRSAGDMFAELGRQLPLAMATFGLHPDLAMGPHDSFNVVLAIRAVGGEAHAHEVRATFYLTWSRRQYATVVASPALYQQFFGMLGASLARSRSGN